MKSFSDLKEQEVLALAISNEDEDSRIYRSFADGLRASYPDTAAMYDAMAREEIEHHDMLLDLHRKKFGEFLPLIRRQDVKGFVARRPIWLNRPLGLDAVRKFAAQMEYETARFYRRAAETTHDDAVREMLTRLAAAEEKHEKLAQELGEKSCAERARRRGRNRAAHVLAAIRPAGAGRSHGRFRLDAGATVRSRLRHPRYLVDFPRRPCGGCRRRHLDGVCRGPVR